MNFRNFWQIIILSFHSANLYLSVANKWKHWGLNFLLRFSTLISIIVSIILFTFIASTNFNKYSSVFDQTPELSIKNDQASLVDDNIILPSHIKIPDTNQDIIIIDLSITNADKYQQNIIVFTKDRIALNIIDSGSFAITYHDLLQGSDIKIINTQSLIELFQNGKNKLLTIILILGVPIISLTYFMVTILKAALYAFIASALAKLLKYNLSFKQLTRLAVIVNTPATVISFILMLVFFKTGIFNKATAIIIDNVYLFYFVCVFTLCGRKKEP
jgi:hypothetical protein